MTTYKFNEDKLLEELKNYLDKTYDEHYGKTKIQAIENIIDKGHGTGFCMGNIEKYFCRYGQKEGYNRKDLWKIIHYTLLQLYIHDKEKLPEMAKYDLRQGKTYSVWKTEYPGMPIPKIDNTKSKL